MHIRTLALLGAMLAARTGLLAQPTTETPGAVVLRVATFNIEDARSEDFQGPGSSRLRRLAEVIQRLRPNVLFLNEIACDMAGAPGVLAGQPMYTNAQRFADNFLGVPQGPGLAPLRYKAFMAPVNTGVPSGFDLDHDGNVARTYPASTPGAPQGAASSYGNDCWGFGTFPGQYGMALLADERLTILAEKVRTFRLLPWDYMPGALLPQKPDGTGWYSPEELKFIRLSSKSHWDVPVQLPGGAVVHFLCSHPTPPVFDGDEKRNARRNHDEIRFWADYLDGSPYIVDDSNTPGGLAPGSWFVVLGDLNADPHRGQSMKDPIGKFLLAGGRFNTSITPTSDVPLAGLDPEATSTFKLRVDYVLPSRELGIARAGVWRLGADGLGKPPFPSDHFPVWVEIVVPPLPGETIDDGKER